MAFAFARASRLDIDPAPGACYPEPNLIESLEVPERE